MTATDKAIKYSTAAVVVGVAAVAAYVSYRHAYQVVWAHGEHGATARLIPLTIDGLVYVSSMVLLDAARRHIPVPVLARWMLALGIAATVAANVLEGTSHGPIGAVIAAWPAVTLVFVVELLMKLIRAGLADEPAPLPADVDPKVAEALHVFAAELAERSPVPSGRRIKAALEVGQTRAVRIKAQLDQIWPKHQEGILEGG